MRTGRMSPVTTRHCHKGSHNTDVAHRSRPETLGPCRSESFVANTLFIGPPSSCLSTKVPGQFPFRLPPSVAGGRRNVLRQRADRMRKLSRWADNSKGSIHGPKRVRHGRLRPSPMGLSELKGWAENPSTSQRVKSLLRAPADSGSLSEWREHGDRENAILPTPRLMLPIFDVPQPVIRSTRHRRWPRLAPGSPPWRRRRSSYCHAAWRRCRCAPFPVRHRDAALQSIHRSCLPRP